MCKEPHMNCSCPTCVAHKSNATGDQASTKKSKHLILAQDIGGYLGLLDQGVDIFNKIKHPNLQVPKTPVVPTPAPGYQNPTTAPIVPPKKPVPMAAVIAGGALLVLLIVFVFKKGGGNG